MLGSGTKTSRELREGASEVLLTRPLSSIVELDRPNYTVTAEAGILPRELKAALEPEGFYVPIPLVTGTLGGLLATNPYPWLRRGILGMRALLADGSVVDLGGKVVTLSDSGGFIYDEEGVDRDKLAWVMDLKNNRRGRISEYADKYPNAVYTPVDAAADYNPLWDVKADCAFPSATQNEINGKDAQNLINNGVYVVSEGANMPSTPDAVNLYIESKILYGPGKAANAGGVAVSGLEMAQNSMRYSWTREEVDNRLHLIMKSIHQACIEAAERFGTPGNYVNGANIAGFLKTADAMMDLGIV